MSDVSRSTESHVWNLVRAASFCHASVVGCTRIEDWGFTKLTQQVWELFYCLLGQ